jgi:hypothetical protein
MRAMPQVVEYPQLTGDLRAAFVDLVKLCREVPDTGAPFRDVRAGLRAARLWDRERPASGLRFIGSSGATVLPSSFMKRMAATTSDDEMYVEILDRLWDLNPLLFKTILELTTQRAHGKDEIYKFLGSFAYRGAVPSRPALEAWIVMATHCGLFKTVGIAIVPGPRAERYARPVADFVLEEFLAEDKALPEPIVPGEEDPGGVAPTVDGAPSAVTGEATGAVIAAVGQPLPPALRHLIPSSALASPRGRGRAVPVARLLAAGTDGATRGFSDEIRADTTARISAWWGEVAAQPRGFGPGDFGLDAEAWVEGADEVLYRIAVAAALAFRLDTDRAGVIAAFKALEQANVLGDLYHGTVPDTLSGAVDAKALMLASLAARRCAESPDLAATIDQQATAAGVFAALDGVLGRGLFRIELFWILDMLAQLGVVRHDDLAELTVLPHRLVRDTLFRLGFVDSPYAADATTLAAAARIAHHAAGPQGRPDDVLASFALAAGCGYDCAHRRTCEYACRERLE